MQISDGMRGIFLQNAKLTILGKKKKMIKTCIVLQVNPGKKITAVALLCPFTFSRLIWSYCGGEGWKAFGK